jgi:hypothetical protein
MDTLSKSKKVRQNIFKWYIGVINERLGKRR